MALRIIRARSFVALLPRDNIGDSSVHPDFAAFERDDEWIGTQLGSLRMWFRPRQSAAEPDPDFDPRTHAVLLGDDAEVAAGAQLTTMVNAATLRFDAAAGRLTLHTSAVSLPPIYAYTDEQRTVLTSDLFLLAALPGVSLELDPASVRELGRIGHPVGHKTLFKRTQLLPGGARVSADAVAGLTVERAWRLAASPPVDWDEFIRTQITAFTESVRRIDVSRSFLSLTAGLDTRTVLAALAREGRLIPAVTMSGLHPSLDARTAARLARAYSMRHHTVRLDQAFTRALPDYVQEASLLSGGLESLEQAPEVYLYRTLGDQFAARVSGNLGNQVGRGGTEGVGTRGASLDILSDAFAPEPTDEGGHWLLGELTDAGSALEFILQREIPFSSVANFSVGNYFALQQSPYASRPLVETLAFKPTSNGSSPSASMLRMRLRDLNHRFLGEPARISFQRSLLQRLGGPAARYPINYGWRATGGVAPGGLALGVAALLGMVVQKTGLDEGPLGRRMIPPSLPALHNFRRSATWLREDLGAFTRDLLSSAEVRQADLFNRRNLDTVLQHYFAGRKEHHQTVVFALDVALAHKNFCVRRARH